MKVNRKELIAIIQTCEDNADLNYLDVSEITDMRGLFDYSWFTGNISKWDVSNVKDMNSMFYESKFNGDLSNWDVSNVENINWMFYKSAFTGDISSWNTPKINKIINFHNNKMKLSMDILLKITPYMC